MAEEFERNPFGLPDADTNLEQFGLGLLNIPDYLFRKNKQIGDAILAAPGQLVDYLGAPTESGQKKIDAENILNDPLGEFGGDMDLPQAPEFPIPPLDPNLPPYDPSGLDVEFDAEQQAIERREIEDLLEKDRVASAEAFREKEAQLVETQGGLNSMSIAESEKAKSELNAEDGFMAAMDDFLGSARGAGPEVPKDRTIAEYKKAFSEATGIDTSGKVDKKDALMAFGLALMQNKAGKGFNVSKMLTEVGVAGDKALPALEKAKERARQGALAGGKYALQTQSSDKAVRAAAEEKMLNRDNYWVYKKGTADQPFEGFDTGQFEDLNKYELDKLMKDPKFQEQYEYISASDRMTVLSKRDEARIAAQDKGDMWGGGERTSMLGGEANKQGELFQIFGAFKDSNYNGETPTTFNVLENAEHRVEQLLDAQENIIKQSNQLGEISSLIGEGVTFGAQIQADVVQFGRALGIDIGGKPSSVKLAQQKLQKIALQKATEILKESGKTLSDGDRKRVDEYVGKISKWTAGGTDAALLAVNLQNIYEIVVDQPQRDINQALDWLEENAGVKLGREEPRNSIFSPSSAEELVAFNKATGQNLTMKDFQ